MIGFLLNSYIDLEKAYIKNSFYQGVKTDKFEKVLKNPYKKDFTFESKEDEDDEDLVDNSCVILDKTSKRALSTLNMATACAMLNFISDDILSNNIFG